MFLPNRNGKLIAIKDKTILLLSKMITALFYSSVSSSCASSPSKKTSENENKRKSVLESSLHSSPNKKIK